MAILPVGIGPQEGGYQIERSLRFNSADSAYFSRTPGSAGNRKTWTFSFWFKRGLISDNVIFGSRNASVTTVGYIGFQSDKFDFQLGSTGNRIQDAAVRRDPSAWAHYVVVCDTPNATSTDRMQLWVNGVRVTTFTTASYPSQNADSDFNVADFHAIGRYGAASAQYADGYLAEVHFIDGSALDPTSFGEYNTDTGVWQPKAYTGSYGTNGFYLDFADNSSTTALGYDAAGSNDWTPNNFSVTAGAGNDSLVDTPTPYGTDTGVGGEVRGNYATLNPLDQVNSTFSNGNLNVTVGTGGGSLAFGNFPMTTGKWYWEIVPTSSTNSMIGIADAYQAIGTRSFVSANGWYYYSNGQKYNNLVSAAYGASYTTNDVIGVAYDADNGTLVFYKNGVSQGTAYTGLSGKGIIAALNNGSSSTTESYVANFGQRPFAYAAPSGFKALCTQNLPEPTVVDGGEYFNTVLYTGNGSTQTVSGVGFQPDLVWIKNRQTTNAHKLVDAVRGAGISLSSNSTDAEGNESLYFTNFTSDGFDLALGGGGYNAAYNYVAWNWKAGGTGVSNTAGTITSTVSANTTAGFSIVTYTGTGSNATIGHGLGSALSFLILKRRDASSGGGSDWPTWHKALTGDQYLSLSGTGGYGTLSSVWNGSVPTSSVFSTGTAIPAGSYVAYCFAPVAGYSAFGSYTGNGSTDGVFVYTGFRPRWIMVKRTDTTADWVLYDTERNTYNVATLALYPNLSNAEGTVNPSMDILSNGVKFRNLTSTFNASGGTYIYAAFAENPFKFSLAR